MAVDLSSIGVWASGPRPPAFDPQPLVDLIHEVRQPVHVVRDPRGGRLGVAVAGQVIAAPATNGHPTLPLMGSLPALYPEWPSVAP
jgi:trans-AT polyketide synthase/acyltransferase/oxidoreductase domain-containing protein